MLHFLDVVEERFDEREELAEGRLFAKTLLMPLHRIPLHNGVLFLDEFPQFKRSFLDPSGR
jgi:hypothetical protein